MSSRAREIHTVYDILETLEKRLVDQAVRLAILPGHDMYESWAAFVSRIEANRMAPLSRYQELHDDSVGLTRGEQLPSPTSVRGQEHANLQVIGFALDWCAIFRFISLWEGRELLSRLAVAQDRELRRAIRGRAVSTLFGGPLGATSS